MILTNIKDIKRIVKEISKIKKVKAIYLFGSQINGKVHPLSDIDICIFGELNEKQKDRILDFSSHNLDITFFKSLPIMIQFRILNEGKLFFIRDKDYIHNLKLITMRRYFDFKSSINKYCKDVLKCTI